MHKSTSKRVLPDSQKPVHANISLVYIYLRNNLHQVLTNNKDIVDYIKGMRLEVGSVFFQHFDTKTQLVIELHDKITYKQISKIESETGTEIDSIALHYNPISDHHCVDLVFKR